MNMAANLPEKYADLCQVSLLVGLVQIRPQCLAQWFLPFAHRSLERSEPLQPPFHVKGRPASEEALLPLPDLLYSLNRSIFQNYDAL